MTKARVSVATGSDPSFPERRDRSMPTRLGEKQLFEPAENRRKRSTDGQKTPELRRLRRTSV
jgi:hypothetical protein